MNSNKQNRRKDDHSQTLPDPSTIFISDVKRKLREKSLTQETMVVFASLYACYFNPTPLSISIIIV